MNAYHAQIESACRAAQVIGPARYLWFGKLITTVPLTTAERRAMTPSACRGHLLASLRQTLYTNFYCQGAAVPGRRRQTGSSRVGLAHFVDQLSAANAGAGCWEDGWVVQRAAAGDEAMLLARDGDLSVRAWAGEYAAQHRGNAAEGTFVRLHLPKEYPGVAPGFYLAAGDTPIRQKYEQRALRLYWHVTSQSAVRLVACATAALNAAAIPFRLKVLEDPMAYTRCDAAVLYVYEYDWGALASILARLHSELAPELMPIVPAFTSALGPGLGLAEDLPGGESFGLHRCQLVADGLIRAFEGGDTTPEARVRAVEERFTEDGIHIEAPYLNPGSADVYIPAFQPEAARNRRLGATDCQIGAPFADCAASLEIAAGIGHRLVREALWHRGRCNWVGPLSEDATSKNGAYTLPAGARLTCGTLGPDLYAGTSGIGLFLAALAVVTNDTGARQTAVGGIRQALERADSVLHEARLGLYAGWSGIAWAAAQVGLLLDCDDLLRGAKSLLERLVHAREMGMRQGTPRMHDLVGGTAGAVVALVAVARLLSEPALLAHAAELGDDLLRAAQMRDGSYSWAAPNHPRQRHLTGLAHGAAGIGYALVELGSATNRQEYWRAAEMAFHYERACFDATSGGWPDFRGVPAVRFPSSRTGEPAAFPSAVAWCHGAPGIALSRLRAHALLGGDSYRNEALTALDTTARAVRSALAGQVDDFSLCHGLAGCADILLDACRALGQERAGDAALVEEVAAFGAVTYATAESAWPCDFADGEALGLMRGLAGIGHFYLRLSDPDVASVLLPLRLQEHVLTPSRGSL